MDKAENSSDLDDSYIYTISHINKVSSKNIIKLRINNCAFDFQIESGASVNVICKHDFNKLKILTSRCETQKFLHMGSRYCYQLKVVFIRILYFMTELNTKILLGIDSATSSGVFKILNSITNK